MPFLFSDMMAELKNDSRAQKPLGVISRNIVKNSYSMSIDCVNEYVPFKRGKDSWEDLYNLEGRV
jgi:hypothetical protein